MRLKKKKKKYDKKARTKSFNSISAPVLSELSYLSELSHRGAKKDKNENIYKTIAPRCHHSHDFGTHKHAIKYNRVHLNPSGRTMIHRGRVLMSGCTVRTCSRLPGQSLNRISERYQEPKGLDEASEEIPFQQERLVRLDGRDARSPLNAVRFAVCRRAPSCWGCRSGQSQRKRKNPMLQLVLSHSHAAASVRQSGCPHTDEVP